MAALAHIDGPNGVGKTTLRRAVAMTLRVHGVRVYSVDDTLVRRSARLTRSYSHARTWFVRAACRRGADVVLVERGLASHLVFDHVYGHRSPVGALRSRALRCEACHMHDRAQQWVLEARPCVLHSRLKRRHKFKPAAPVHWQVQAYWHVARDANLTTLRLRTKGDVRLAAARIANHLLSVWIDGQHCKRTD